MAWREKVFNISCRVEKYYQLCLKQRQCWKNIQIDQLFSNFPPWLCIKFSQYMLDDFFVRICADFLEEISVVFLARRDDFVCWHVSSLCYFNLFYRPAIFVYMIYHVYPCWHTSMRWVYTFHFQFWLVLFWVLLCVAVRRLSLCLVCMTFKRTNKVFLRTVKHRN